MAVIAYDNLLQTSREDDNLTMELVGGGTPTGLDIDKLISPQLDNTHFLNNVVVTAGFGGVRQTVDSFIVAGTFSTSTRLAGFVKIEIFNPDAGAWLEREIAEVINVESTTFGQQHAIYLLSAREVATGVRLTFGNEISPAAYLGVCKSLRGDVLTGQAVAFGPADTAQKDASIGGQLYTGPGTTRRRMDLPYKLPGDYWQFGGLIDPVDVPIVTPTVTGPGSGGWGSNTGSVVDDDQTFTFVDQLVDGASGDFWQIDYRITPRSNADLPEGAAARIETETGTSGIESWRQKGLTGNRNQLAFGTGTIYGKLFGDDLVIKAELDTASPTGYNIEILAIRRDRADPDETSLIIDGGITEFMGIAGTSGPVMVSLSNKTTLRATSSGFFGVIESWRQNVHLENEIYEGGFTLLETL